jgi:hypothetical protein
VSWIFFLVTVGFPRNILKKRVFPFYMFTYRRRSTAHASSGDIRIRMCRQTHTCTHTHPYTQTHAHCMQEHTKNNTHTRSHAHTHTLFDVYTRAARMHNIAISCVMYKERSVVFISLFVLAHSSPRLVM